MQPKKISSWGVSLIVMVFWLDVNDAVPFGPYAEGKARLPASRQSKDWKSTKSTVPITGQPETFSEVPKSTTDSPIKLPDVKGSDYNFNRHVHVDEIHPDIVRPESRQQKSHRKESMENDISDNDDSLTDNGEKSKSRRKNYNGSDFVPDVKKHLENMKNKEEEPEKCLFDGRRKIQAYTRSFPLNVSSIDLADAFIVAGDAEAKKTSSVHTGEDITICWIETTTVKEDSTFDPPKRLVIREFTISFENSATIPESYLDCAKLDGEITPGDEETVCKTSLREVIDENTQRSRVVNFTSTSQVGPIDVYQQKTVRCAVGGVVFKDIYEWPNGSDNPKKRVEIKVGPSIRNVDVRSNTGSGECTNEAVARESEEDRSTSFVSDCTPGESCETPVTCENDKQCNEQETASPCEDDNCVASSLSEETPLTTDPPENNKLSTSNATKITSIEKTKELSASKNSSSFSTHTCSEYDTDCQLGKTTPEPNTKEIGICSGEDCTGGSSDKAAGDPSSDESEDISVPCAEEDCTSKEESDTAGLEGITKENSESCEEGSGSCSCSGSSCSINSSEESDTSASGNKLVDKTTASSVSKTNEMTFNDPGCDSESAGCSSSSSETTSRDEEETSGATFGINDSEIKENSTKSEKETTLKNVDVVSTTDRHEKTKLSSEFSSHEEEKTSVTTSGRNDSKIEEHSTKYEKETASNYSDFVSTTGHHGETKLSSETSSQEEEKTSATTSGSNDSEIGEHSTKYEKETTPKNSDLDSTTNRHGETELSDGNGTTGVRESNGVSSTEAALSPCHDSKSEGCTTLVAAGPGLSDELATGMEKYSSVTEKMEHSVATKEDSSISRTEHGNDERSFSCGEDSANENCQSTGYSRESESEDNYVTDFFSPKVYSTKQTPLSVSEEHARSTNSVDDAVTTIPIASTDLQTPIIEGSTELPGTIKKVTLLNDESSSGEDSVTECISNSKEGSGDCGRKEKDIPSLQSEETTASPESCESSGKCASMHEISSSTEKNQTMSINSTTTNENPGETSCDDSRESCEKSSSSGSSSEICEDGSSGGNCTSNGSTAESCDSSTGSCSPEADSSIGLIDETITMTTEPTTKGLEHFSTIADNVSTTAETRRSTTPTLSLISAPTKGRPRLALKIKVLLEHIDENKEKEKLLQVEKHLLLNERPGEHGNHSLVWQIKSLNNSINMETIRSIFNCTALQNLTEELSNLTEFKNKIEERISLSKEVEDPSVQKSKTEAEGETQDNLMEGSKESSSRKKREIHVPEGNGERDKNVTDLTKAKAIRESLPGVEEDFQKGLDHVLSRISQELVGTATSTVTKPAESSSSSTILKILANPTDGRVHSPRRKRASEDGGVVSIKELENPINGEEIDRWSNERFVRAADGGQIRSVLEFNIMRNPSEDSRRISSGS